LVAFRKRKASSVTQALFHELAQAATKGKERGIKFPYIISNNLKLGHDS
jgi:hypothetical protein